MDAKEIHIAGAIVQVAPKRISQTRRAIACVPQVEIRAAGGHGRLVVVVEAESEAAVLARLDAMQRLDGVLSTLLVYQHAESAQCMDEEVIDDGIAT